MPVAQDARAREPDTAQALRQARANRQARNVAPRATRVEDGVIDLVSDSEEEEAAEGETERQDVQPQQGNAAARACAASPEREARPQQSGSVAASCTSPQCHFEEEDLPTDEEAEAAQAPVSHGQQPFPLPQPRAQGEHRSSPGDEAQAQPGSQPATGKGSAFVQPLRQGSLMQTLQRVAAPSLDVCANVSPGSTSSADSRDQRLERCARELGDLIGVSQATSARDAEERWAQCLNKVKACKTDLEKKEREIEQLNCEISAWNESDYELEKAKSSCQRLERDMKELKSRHQDEMTSLRTELSAVNSRAVKQEERIEELKREAQSQRSKGVEEGKRDASKRYEKEREEAHNKEQRLERDMKELKSRHQNEMKSLRTELSAENSRAAKQEERIEELKREAQSQRSKGVEEGKRDASKRYEKEREEADNKEQRRQSHAKILKQEIVKKQNEVDRLNESLRDKGNRVSALHEEKKALTSKLKDLEKQSEQQIKNKDKEIAELIAERKDTAGVVSALKEQIKRLQVSTTTSTEKRGPVLPASDNGNGSSSSAPATKGKEARERISVSVSQGLPVPDERHLVFGPTYVFGRGGPKKDLQPGRDHTALPYDDAFGGTSKTLVLCDGVGQGMADSGRWARSCVRACLRSSSQVAHLLPSASGPRNHAGEMVQCAMRELKREDDSSFRNKKATTTLLALRLEDKIEGGKQSFRIDACEIGDSRWAMLCWDEKRKRYCCNYLAAAHMHEENLRHPAPFQIGPPSQNFGRGPDYYFGETKTRKQVLKTQKVDVSPTGECQTIIIAGSDGLWDNAITAQMDEADVPSQRTSEAIKQWLEKHVNECYQNLLVENNGVDFNDLIKSVGNTLKFNVVNRMAGVGGKSDDLSLFVSKIQAHNGSISKDVMDWSFSKEDTMSHEEIRAGIEFFVEGIECFVDAKQSNKRKRPAHASEPGFHGHQRSSADPHGKQPKLQ